MYTLSSESGTPKVQLAALNQSLSPPPLLKEVVVPTGIGRSIVNGALGTLIPSSGLVPRRVYPTPAWLTVSESKVAMPPTAFTTFPASAALPLEGSKPNARVTVPVKPLSSTPLGSTACSRGAVTRGMSSVPLVGCVSQVSSLQRTFGVSPTLPSTVV